MTDRNQDVARIVRMLMALRDLRQPAVAEALGLHQSGVSRALKGKRVWTLDDLDKLAELFDVPVSTFYEDPAVVLRSRCFGESAGQVAVAA